MPTPIRAALTRIMRLSAMISVCMAVLTMLGEWLTPTVVQIGWPGWAVTIVIDAVRYSLGFSITFALVALVAAHQRAQLGK